MEDWNTVALFDGHAAGYDAWYATPMGSLVDRLEKDAVFDLLGPRPGMRVLDVGCGTGNYTLELAAAGLAASGVDVSGAMLERAREKAAARNLNVSLAMADAGDLPFAGDTFDAAVSVTALEFVRDPAGALREAYRVLRPGGRLVAGVLARDSAWGRFYREAARSRPDSVFGRARFFTVEELRALMPGDEVTVRAALFVPPDFDFEQVERVLKVEGEARRAGRTDGGFLCAMVVK